MRLEVNSTFLFWREYNEAEQKTQRVQKSLPEWFSHNQFHHIQAQPVLERYISNNE